jgi:hypothetical protein
MSRADVTSVVRRIFVALLSRNVIQSIEKQPTDGRVTVNKKVVQSGI